jgi:glycosidase
MAGDKGKGDADIRQDFPGGWKGDANNAFSASGRTVEQAKFFDFSKKILNWRKNKEVIHTGKLTHYIPENNIYVYFRHNEKETVMVVINNNPQSQILNVSRFQENIKSFTKGKDVLSGKEISLKEELSIEGKSTLILELK